ncbi:anti-sigma factor [Neptunitalea chrysea]|uniref:Anti-sigma factor n=1 Tax=Neptunitalea chrysea TaxID=1647581 RepID=A0A9W6EW71_9FLAO|nr:FecR domain-containing protein [Neptunitalea chrysea]GLB53886.1 anti-sigma factor [Neptunitalea chrysea]
MKDIEKKLLNNFQEKDKTLLKKRIMSSVERYKRKRKIKRLYWAAAIAVLIIVSGAVYKNAQRFDDSYVKLLETTKVGTIKEVQLVLSDDVLTVSKSDSIIVYNNSDNMVLIGNSKTAKNSAIVMNTVVVPYGRHTQLKLADGTHIWLNAGSKLVYPSSFSGDKRIVYLEGEAAFDVAHDKQHPFTVKAKNHEIEVLGTVFNVSCYSDEKAVTTALESGSVRINYESGNILNTKKSVTITPGTIASYNKDEKQVSTKEGNVSNYFLWRKGLIVFKNDDMEYILKRLSRYYNVPIEVRNKDRFQQTFSGYLDLKTNIEEVLNIISESSTFTYTKQENNIIIE